MESSSDDSFAWTDTSSDSVNSTSMAEDDINENSDKNSTLNDGYGKKMKEKKPKIKHNDKSVDSGSKVVIKDEKAYCETKTNSRVMKKMIKTEPDSENDLRKKHKKITQTENNGNQNEDSMSYDETYLNLKVKQEESSALSSTKHKHKKRKRTSSIDSTTTTTKSNGPNNYQNNSSSEINRDNVSLKRESENDTEISKSKKKKKKKSKKHWDSDDHSLHIEDKMDIEETIVNKQGQTHSKHSNGNDTDICATENTTLQDESDESGCDEISAIKCDDSHSLHTISFINKSTEEIGNIDCNSSLNIITKVANKSVPEQDSNQKVEATNHRKQRISDRIRFEDDDDTNIESSQVEDDNYSQNNKKQLKLKQFHSKHPNLKLLPQTFDNNTNFTRDDEIWLLKCPKEININDFNNTTLNIHSKCKIKVGGQTFEGSAEEERLDTISLLTKEHNKYKIRNVPLYGIINLRKRIPKAHFRDDNIMVNNQTNFIPLPETKCRHPLFGSNYKKALKIPSAIAVRLNVQDSEETLTRTEKRKKKNKKDKNTSEHIEQVQTDIPMKSEPEHSVEIKEKKKKKRKIIDDEGPVSKKVKRIKHDPGSAEAWESEKAIEENLFNF